MALTRRSFLGSSLAVTAAASLAPRESFAAYPEQELVWLIYQAPGGTIDVSTRVLQAYMEKAGFKVRLEYATGASGRVARNKLYAAKPDGYTIMSEIAPGAIVDELVYNVPYKAESFTPVFGWSNTGFQYCVRSESPIKTFGDFVAETKKRRVTVASIGRGGAQHLHIVAMRKALDLKFDIVHFDGASPAYAAVLGGHVDIGGGGPASGKRQGGDRLRFLALTGEQREYPLEDIPTLKELGYGNVPPVDQLFFASMPPGTPADRVAQVAKAIEIAVADPDFAEKMKTLGYAVMPMTPDAIKAGHHKHRELIMEFKEELKK